MITQIENILSKSRVITLEQMKDNLYEHIKRRVKRDGDWIEPADTCVAIMPGDIKPGSGIQALVPPSLLFL